MGQGLRQPEMIVAKLGMHMSCSRRRIKSSMREGSTMREKEERYKNSICDQLKEEERGRREENARPRLVSLLVALPDIKY